MTRKHYADISWFQRGLQLGALRPGMDTIGLRASAGSTFRDTAFPAWWQEAGRLGFRRLAYHFQYENRGAVEAGNFLGAVSDAGGFAAGDLAMNDIETLGDPNPATGGPRAIEWAEVVHSWQPSIGQTLYGNGWYLRDGGIVPSRLPNVGIVVAAYPNGNAPYTPPDNVGPALPPGWDHACGWQYTSVGRVPGWGAGVDLNVITCPSNWAHLMGSIDPRRIPALPGAAWPTITATVGSPNQVGAMRRLLSHAGFPDADDGRPVDLIDADRVGRLQAAHGLTRDGLFGPQSLYAALGIRQSSPATSAWPTMTPGVAATHPYQLGAQRTLLNRVGMWDVDDGRPYVGADAGATKQYQTIVNQFAHRQVINPTGNCEAVTITYLLGCQP